MKAGNSLNMNLPDKQTISYMMFVRREGNGNLVKEADAKPEEAEKVLATQEVLKAWIFYSK
jgi:hypothetical protein